MELPFTVGVSPHGSRAIFHPLQHLFVPLSDSIGSGETDEGVLVPEPICQANGTAHQEDPGQDSQLSGEGQGVMRGEEELQRQLPHVRSRLRRASCLLKEKGR